ncbi:four helix bundle protein [Reichenbachiella agarivorans]|uniref:Four helix bundle protein n=1 Tax=Reichenbachiella agarivorans TaxID=2979464 RepID=A0ABY6CMX6_9BACT|nr:four helix bundle protein [Reichenbachiella agarivorans]UXP31867.1 four helix bundle protein [Reichenbachiella agarivorans]
MSTVKRFEDLDSWKEARVFVKSIYLFLESNHRIDRDTQSQLRRAALSIMNNIAEGFGRNGNKEFIRFLNIASASAAEVKSIMYVIQDLNYIQEDTVQKIPRTA